MSDDKAEAKELIQQLRTRWNSGFDTLMERAADRIERLEKEIELLRQAYVRPSVPLSEDIPVEDLTLVERLQEALRHIRDLKRDEEQWTFREIAHRALEDKLYSKE